jgi:EAL domain-containing protein (putative c-di-GMP-specific phosphodiesterase class I)
MDDFGSGYSSLNTLKDIYVDVLKIDLKFLRDSDKNTRALSIMKFVIQMTKELQIETIVEGVETHDQVEFLKNIGVTNAQGFYYFRPMPVSDFEAIVLKNKTVEN